MDNFDNWDNLSINTIVQKCPKVMNNVNYRATS